MRAVAMNYGTAKPASQRPIAVHPNRAQTASQKMNFLQRQQAYETLNAKLLMERKRLDDKSSSFVRLFP